MRPTRALCCGCRSGFEGATQATAAVSQTPSRRFCAEAQRLGSRRGGRSGWMLRLRPRVGRACHDAPHIRDCLIRLHWKFYVSLSWHRHSEFSESRKAELDASMVDVFVSYVRRERVRAERIKGKLEGQEGLPLTFHKICNFKKGIWLRTEKPLTESPSTPPPGHRAGAGPSGPGSCRFASPQSLATPAPRPLPGGRPRRFGC
jgi:hypothetical protein